MAMGPRKEQGRTPEMWVATHTLPTSPGHPFYQQLNRALDAHGFDEVDRKLLLTIIEKFGGGPVGIGAIAAAISEEPDAIEDMYEPYLLQLGFLDRTPRGRTVTRRAYEHFGRMPPEGTPGQKKLF